jgi:hypothetical protein
LRTKAMRRALGLLAMVLVACAPKPVAEPVRPEPAPAPAPAVSIPEAAPAPAAAPAEPAPPPLMAEIAGLDAEARWAWAVERFPALADHAAIDHDELVAQLPEWFPNGRVFVRTTDSKCFPVVGEWTDGSFVGRARETVTVKGRTKERVWYTIEISPTGIIETGPGAETYTRNAKGKWEVTGGWGIGCMDVLAHRWLSEVTPEAIYFAGYEYTLTIECAGVRKSTDVCEGGGERVCEACSGLLAQRHASNMGFGHGRIGIMSKSATPIDCTVPCPADTLSPLVEPLGAIVKGRRFSGLASMDGAVYKSRRACQRDPRWTPPAEAEELGATAFDPIRSAP